MIHYDRLTDDELAHDCRVLKDAAAVDPRLWESPEARAIAAEILRRAKVYRDREYEASRNPLPPLRVTVVP